MEDNDLHPEPEPNKPDNEHEVDEDGNFLNISQSSQSSNMGFPQTLQIQREIFILRGDYITPQDEYFPLDLKRQGKPHVRRL